MNRTLIALAIFGLITAACGLAAGDTQATVAAQVNATVAAIPPKEVTISVPQQVIVTQEVIVTQQVLIEVPITVVVPVTVPPEQGSQPAATQAPQPAATNPPAVSTTGQDPLAGANVTPIIDERFDFPDKYYWWVFDSTVSSSGEGKIENETYILISKQVENWEWTFDGRKLQNFYLTANTVLPDGQCKAGDHWGLVFRYKDNANFYLFGVSCDGKYLLMKRTVDGFEEILPPTDSLAIKKLGQANIIGVRAVGDRISLYANDQFLITVTDGSFSEGIVGMYARTLLTPRMIAVFDDITAYVVNP